MHASGSLIDALAPAGAMAGRMLGRCEVLQKLASGSMATVYLGRALGVAGFERLVAIECCHPHLRDDADFVGMFFAEARFATQLRHPNVVAALDVDDGEVPYLVMEYIEGDSLSGLLKAGGLGAMGRPPAVVARIIADALAGLHAAHELCDAEGRPHGVVHRDVSPQNVLIGVDVGCARSTAYSWCFFTSR